MSNPFVPLAAWGPITLSSGAANPKKVDGPKRESYIHEHEVPGREGGVVEYIGSKQPTYKLQGFLAPANDVFNGTAAAVLSGSSYVGLSSDDAMHYLQNLRGSGAQLLRVESSWSNFSGYPIMYENDFFYATSMTFAMEAGRGYPYYPYTIDLMRATYTLFGNTSGEFTLQNDAAPAPFSGAYLSGYIRSSSLLSGWAKGGLVIGLGFQCLAVNGGGGHVRLAVYSGLSIAPQLIAQTASQSVVSGWNYFPLNPSFLAQSGYTYFLAIMADTTTNGAFALGYSDISGVGTGYSLYSGYAYTNGFPNSLVGASGYGGISGYALNIAIITV